MAEEKSDTFDEAYEEAEEISEDEKLEQEEGEQLETKKTPDSKKSNKTKPATKQQPKETLTSKYEPVSQEAFVGIRDTLTGKIIDTTSPVGMAYVLSMILNNQEKFAISAGYN
jgi:hypothetical protein